jgi:hypothetical protein
MNGRYNVYGNHYSNSELLNKMDKDVNLNSTD